MGKVEKKVQETQDKDKTQGMEVEEKVEEEETQAKNDLNNDNALIKTVVMENEGGLKRPGLIVLGRTELFSVMELSENLPSLPTQILNDGGRLVRNLDEIEKYKTSAKIVLMVRRVGIADLAVRKPDIRARCRKPCMRPARKKRVIDRGCGHRHRIGVGGVADTPSVHDAKYDGMWLVGRLHWQVAFSLRSRKRLMESAATVIGMAGKDHHRAIKLLCQHRPKQHVGPGGASKGDS